MASVDTLVMPYGNERYLYHTSAILSNAIGFKKTIIIPNIFSEDKGLHIGIILACIKVFISVSEIFSGLAFLDTFLPSKKYQRTNF